LQKTFDVFQVVHLRNVVSPLDATSKSLTWKDLASTFEKLDPADQASWTVESQADPAQSIVPASFLKGDADSGSTRAYGSFLIQKDKAVLQSTLARLPVVDLELPSTSYEPALWIFFGRNPPIRGGGSKQDLSGRAEHTDAVSHSGTWHYQLSGRKVWTLRPSSAMHQHLNEHFVNTGGWCEEQRLSVCVEENDVLLINTRLWFHQTTIPCQTSPSVSYARDFWLADHKKGGNLAQRAQRNDNESTTSSVDNANMTNVDGLYATEAIEEGTIIFRETDLPECELHRASGDASNCELVDLEDGTRAIVSTRDIAAGEFFCIAETDNEGDEEEDEGDEDESDMDEDGDDAQSDDKEDESE
jgi:hypothetical protein